MTSFQWGQHFVTGLLEVDHQHRRLIAIINRFGNLLTDNQVHAEDMEHLHAQLMDYAAYHFQEEEGLMREVKVDARHLGCHVQVHEQFLEDVSSLSSGMSSDDLYRAKSFLKFLIHWLAYHILGQDQDMANQIKAIESGFSPHDAYEKMEQDRIAATAPLLDALNALFEQVSMRNRELKELNELLEEKVAIRTQELSKANRHLEELSLTDVLTGLPNRRHAIRRLADDWQGALETDKPLTCMMIDADHFKQVNDAYGHETGDRVLKQLADKLRHSFRNDDVVCRLGGDEFFIICPDTGKQGGMYIAEVVRQAVSELRVSTGGKPWCGSISIGVASRSPDMQRFDELIMEADRRLYAAKDAGKNCVR